MAAKLPQVPILPWGEVLQLKQPRVLEKSANNALMTKFPADDGTFEYADEVRLPNVLETITHLLIRNRNMFTNLAQSNRPPVT